MLLSDGSSPVPISSQRPVDDLEERVPDWLQIPVFMTMQYRLILN